MRASERAELSEALAVTAELTGTELTEGGLRIMVADLDAYPLPSVLAALTRCRRELKGRMSLAVVIERLDDGRPGANEAWALIPQDQTASTVMCDEMATAYGVAWPLLKEGQTIAARMAFIEAYERAVAGARAIGAPVRWFPSLGTDPGGRTAALELAVAKGRITQAAAAALLPGPDRDGADLAMARLTGPRAPIPEAARAQLAAITARLTGIKKPGQPGKAA